MRVVEADPDDDMLIECAVEGKADYLVTGNTKHFANLREYQGIQILTSAEFVLLMQKEEQM